MAGLDIGLTQIVGNSLGGWVALKFAARYPQRVSRMGLLVPVGIAPFKFWSFLPKMLLSNFQRRRGTERFIQGMAAKRIDRATMDFLVESARRQKWSNG
jgi:pimeloyl-ACP methyl ester carboxylesterase